MKSNFSRGSLLVLLLFSPVASLLFAAHEVKLGPLPAAVSNNAVAISHDEHGDKIFSFMGIGAKKTWDATTTSAYELNLGTGKWTEKRPVPGVTGRLAASAVALHEQVFIFGGYVVDGQGGEITLPDMNVFVPAQNKYYRGKDIPVPVDDSVAGVYRDRFIFLIGGWSKTEAVRNVQVYDTEKDEWMQATPLQGTPVFGHAGAITGDTIVYVDGAYKNPDSTGKAPKYLASGECWMGKIAKGDVTRIAWTKLPAHPGNARYRIAAGVAAEKKGGRVYFSGGSDNPYNYNGIGYDGQAAEPSAVTFAFNAKSEKWETINENTPDATMDHRGLLVTQRGLVMVGGMEKGQQVTTKVTVVNAGSRK